MFKNLISLSLIFLAITNLLAENNFEIKNTELKMQEKKILYYVTGNPSKFKLFSSFIPKDASIELKQFEYNLFEEQIEDQKEIDIQSKTSMGAIKKTSYCR